MIPQPIVSRFVVRIDDKVNDTNTLAYHWLSEFIVGRDHGFRAKRDGTGAISRKHTRGGAEES